MKYEQITTSHTPCTVTAPPRGGGGGGVLSPFDGGWGGGRAEKNIYRGVRELLFIPKKGGLENWNKHRPKAVVGRVREGGVPLM